MKGKLFYLGLLSLALVASCAKDDAIDSETEELNEEIEGTIQINNSTITKGDAEGSTEVGYDEEDILANSTFSSVVKIIFGNNIQVVNPLNDSQVNVTVTGSDVVINSTVSEVAYEISGTTTDGSLKIYSEKKFKLTLDDLSLKNSSGAAINIQSGKRVFVVLEGTNTLEDGTSYSVVGTEDEKGTFFSEGQLIFSGSGTLNVASNYGHGIVSDDYIRFIDGTFNVTKASSDAIHSNDGIFVDGGTFNIKAESDGIEADEGVIIINAGTFDINVSDDGIAASFEDDDTIDPYVVINGGTFNIYTVEGEGIESKSTLTINGGDIYINAADDAINAGDAIYINDGKIVAYSRTNDGIDSNGILTVTGGRTLAIGSQNPEAGFDNDNNNFKITGGILIGAGGSTSQPTASVSSQASTILDGGNANTVYSLLDDTNQEILTFKSPVSFATLLISSEHINVGYTYKIATSSSVANATEFNGLYLAGSLSGTTAISQFTQSSLVSSIGGSTGPGGGGRR